MKTQNLIYEIRGTYQGVELDSTQMIMSRKGRDSPRV